MSNVKGLSFVSIRNFINKRYPAKDYQKLKEALDTEVFNVLNNTNPKEFYPLDYYVTINKSIVKLIGNMDMSILKKIGRYSADEAVRGIYKVFFNFGSPQFILKQAAIVFSKYYDEGRMKVIEDSKNNAILELTGFDSLDKDKMQYVCITIEGWIERALEICAGKSASTVQEKCRSNNDASCKFICKWGS